MVTDTVTPADAGSGGTEVMASIDADGDGGGPRLVIADITADGTWLSAPEAVAVSLSEWR